MNELSVNGQARAVRPGVTLEEVVAAAARSTRGVAAAVNGEVVPRSSWRERSLAHGDRVEIVTAVQGG